MNNFNKISEKVMNLKNKIETEINKINDFYEKVLKELETSYQNKHEQLLKEENELKEKLQNEVTKIKEQLENCLSESNIEIKKIERINHGIKNLKKEEKNIMKNLSYISNINKIQKNTNKLLLKLIRNINISYDEKNKNINIEEYYFNGIIKNIEIKDIYCSNLKIYCDIVKCNNNNDEKNKIKLKIEFRKDNENEKFEKAYEGTDTKCQISNLTKGTCYDFRISAFFNENNLAEERNIKVKTLKCDSLILMGTNKGNEYLDKILEWSGFKQMDLLYRGTKDGFTQSSFHNKCDNKGETITLIKNDKDYIFGGFLSISWKGGECYNSAPGSFLFTLSNIHNTEPTQFPSKNDNKEVYYSSRNGPLFGAGCDIGIGNMNEPGWSNFPNTYVDILGKGRTIFTRDLDLKKSTFSIKEIEIFKLSK